MTFYFVPADIVTQILNFGLPAPIDVQIEGNDIEGNRQVANRLLDDLRRVPGLTDLRIQQNFDTPKIKVTVDRVKAAGAGFTPRDVANSVLLSLAGSGDHVADHVPRLAERGQLQPGHPGSPVQHPVAPGPPEHPDRRGGGAAPEPGRRGLDRARERDDGDLALQYPPGDGHLRLGAGPGPGRGGPRHRPDHRCHRPNLPRGSFVTLRGQVETMRASYLGLLGGLAFAIVLVYLLIVVNFQSWLDPFIIITALPAALAGIIVFLFLTGTTLSVPALMGAIMCMGVGTANSILVVSFAKDRLGEHGDARLAAIEAGVTRFRPVLMTALAMIIGMIPMAMGLGEGGEQNAPLGRAVIGGLLLATVATLIFVPAVFSLLHGRGRRAGSPLPSEAAA